MTQEDDSVLWVILKLSTIEVPRKSRDALKCLRLAKVNDCCVVKNSPVYRGIVEKLKNRVVYSFCNLIDARRTLKLVLKDSFQQQTFQKPFKFKVANVRTHLPRSRYVQFKCLQQLIGT